MSTLPTGYTPCQYVQSGATCNIPTGYYANFQRTRVVVDIEPTGVLAGGNILSTFPDYHEGLTYTFNLNFPQAERILYHGAGWDAEIWGTYQTGSRFRIDINQYTGKFTANSNTVDIVQKNFTKSYPLWIYCADNSQLSQVALPSKLYSCKIYDGNTLKMDLVPCKNSAGTAGLYDTVGNKFLTSSSGGLTSGPAVPTYKITLSASPTTGGSVTGGGSYLSGDSVTISAVPAAGYRFLRWEDGGSVVSTSARYTFTATKNRTIVAFFEQVKSYIVTVQASPAEGGTASGGGTYVEGTNVTVTAQPSAWYEFVGWTEGTETASANASYTFQITSNRTLTANFEKITVKPGGPSSGLNRREIYIDARDLQSDSDPENPLTAEEYLAVLQARGLAKLAENQLVKSFSANVRLYNASYQYGVDFFDGDTITVTDERLGVSVDAVVQGAEITWDERGESLVLTLGYGVPTTSDILKRKVDK